MTIEEYKHKFNELASQMMDEHGDFQQIIIKTETNAVDEHNRAIEITITCSINF